MSGKSKQLSVLIAGGTGKVGRELVSRLVSHPDVSRVVVLSRHPIPVSRWRTVFPKMHTGDALRYLSVVTIDWDRVLCDASRIPLAYVSRGAWQPSDEDTEGSIVFTPGTFDGNDIFEDFWFDATFLKTARDKWQRSRNDSQYDEDDEDGVQNDSSRGGGDGVRGRFASREGGSSQRTVMAAEDVPEPEEDEDISAHSPLVGYVEDYPRGSRDSHGEHFLDSLLRNAFYGSVFRGHNVVINALGSHHPLSAISLSKVNYQYALSFAKMVRVFNSMVHAEPTEEEEEELVKATSQELDSVLWGEIYMACYGKLDKSTENYKAIHRQRIDNMLSIRQGQTTTPLEQEGWARGQGVGSAATLKQYTQISVMGASEFSPIPFLRVHGQCDNVVLRMFNRDHDALMRNLARLNDDDAEKDNKEEVARKRAEMLLRRDVVKTCDNNHLTVWRPGIFESRRKLWVKRVIASFLCPVRVDYLAELIVDDIMESIEDEREFNEMGSVKVVSAKSVAIRARMKAVEDKLNLRDTRQE